MTAVASIPKQRWVFAARFRRRAFGWRSQPAIARVREAVSEIRKAARKDPLLGAEGAVLLLEKLSPALRWLAEGYGYEITNLDVRDAYRHTMQAATNAGCAEQALERIRALGFGN